MHRSRKGSKTARFLVRKSKVKIKGKHGRRRKSSQKSDEASNAPNVEKKFKRKCLKYKNIDNGHQKSNKKKKI